MPFEGTEKKFELLVSDDARSFRTLSPGFWERLVRATGADIIGRMHSPACNAYLLSESSLFVSDHRVIMITCGTTSLVTGIEKLLAAVSTSRVKSLIYERKNENFPDLQPSRFEEDVEVLNRLLPGTAVHFGDPGGHHLSLFHLDRPFRPSGEDITLEILMYGLDPAARASFSAAPENFEDRLLVRGGIEEALPGFRTDDYFFDPVGYSLNGIRDGFYFAAHVTPEEPGSYASFETNYPLPGDGIRDLVSAVVGVFRPLRFDVVLFQQDADLGNPGGAYREGHRETRLLSCGYRVRFWHFARRAGAGPRELSFSGLDARGAS